MFVLRSKINFFQRILIVYIFGFFSLVTTATEINLEPNLSVESCIDKWTEKGLLNARTFYYCMSKHTEEFTEPLYHYKKYSNLELRIEAFSYTSMFEKEQFNYKELPGTSIFLENEVIAFSKSLAFIMICTFLKMLEMAKAQLPEPIIPTLSIDFPMAIWVVARFQDYHQC